MARIDRTKLENGTFLVLFALAAYLFWRTLEPIWIPVFLGLTIAVTVYPLQDRLLQRRHLARHPGLAAALLTALVMTVIVGLLTFLLFVVGSRVLDLLRDAADRYQHGGTTSLLGDDVVAFLRRFGARPIQMKDLLANKSIAVEMADFLGACVRARLNVLVSGGTGSGKTTLLNALSAYIPAEHRVSTIEDAAELKLQQPHVGRLETRPPNAEGVGEVTTRDLVRNALRMRPDRILIGECRGPEALDMLQAMNTGHEGSLTTIHANAPRDALARLEIMVSMAGLEIPVWSIRKQIASAVQVIVQVSRLMGGARKVVRIAEVTGMEEDNVVMHDLFVFKQTGVDDRERAQGYFETTGIRPHCLDRLAALGARLPPNLFDRRILSV